MTTKPTTTAFHCGQAVKTRDGQIAGKLSVRMGMMVIVNDYGCFAVCDDEIVPVRRSRTVAAEPGLFPEAKEAE